MLRISVRSLKTTNHKKIAMGQSYSGYSTGSAHGYDDLGNHHEYAIQQKPKVLEITKSNVTKENPVKVEVSRHSTLSEKEKYLLRHYNEFCLNRKKRKLQKFLL